MKIALVLRATLITFQDLEEMVTAINIAVNRDFCPLWGITPITVAAHKDGDNVDDYDCRLYVVDTSDDPNALGYHTPQKDGIVACKPVLDAGGGKLDGGSINTSIASVAMHEVCEAARDLPCNIWADSADGQTQYSYETCDAVESDGYDVSFMSPVDGKPKSALVSSFLLPAFFDPEAKPGTRLDFMKKLTTPLTMISGGGGYQIVRTGLPDPQQQFAQHHARLAAHVAAGGTIEEHPTEPNVHRLYDKNYPTWRKNMRANSQSRFARRMNAIAAPTAPAAAPATVTP